ncbi:MAG: hypothetical protein HUU46_09685 [Candidatus Hydrogenedentes bacterium]|nr:hypothetical protein [Candidatus Hydrogenedentota bacterium]
MRNSIKFYSCRAARVVAALAVVCAWANAEDLKPKSPHHRATIHPSLVYLEPGEEQPFKIVMLATRLMAAMPPKQVTWSVNDIPGGDNTVGTIGADGVYRTPAQMPSPREVHIVAEVPESANRFLFATVIVGKEPIVYRGIHVWSEPVISEETGRSEHMRDPHGIAIDKEGNLIIADQLGSKVVRYTKDGKYLGELGLGSGSEEGHFTEPRIVEVASDGRIFISDSKGDRPRLQIFSPKGEFLKIFAEKGRPDGMLLRCHGLSFGPTGHLFATDVDNMRVNVYDNQGEFLYQWGEEGLNPGQLNAPHGIFVDRSSDVFITSYYGPTQKFDARGNYVGAFAYGDPPDGPVYFHNMTGDRWGNIYCMVRTKSGYQGAISKAGAKDVSIAKYNNNGDFITSWAFSTPEHEETTCTVDSDGKVYALFTSKKELGVETFQQD